MLGKEPAVILGAIAEVVKAVIPACIIFGLLTWTPEQVATVMFVAGVLVSSLTVILTRSNSVSQDTANKQIAVAVDQPAGTSVQKVIDITAAREQ